MAPVELAKAPNNLMNKWVAVEDDTSLIVGYGDTIEEAEESVEGKSKDQFFLLYLVPCHAGFIL